MDEECVEELGKPISSLKVTELRDELTKRGLTKTGNKKELIDRLRQDLQRQSSSRQLNQDRLTDQVEIQQEPAQNTEELEHSESIIDYSSPGKSDQLADAAPDHQSPERLKSPDKVSEDAVDYSSPEREETDQKPEEACTEEVDSNLVTEIPETRPQEKASDTLSCVEEQSKIQEHQHEVGQGIENEKLHEAVRVSEVTVSLPDQADKTEVDADVSKPLLDSITHIPITLKRGLSDLKDSSGSSKGEKRRKWSGKPDKSSGSPQSTSISCGISSQKLQELINLPQPVGTSAATTSHSAKDVIVASEPIEHSKQPPTDRGFEQDKSNVDLSGENATVTDDLVQNKFDESNSETMKKDNSNEPQLAEREPTSGLLIENLVRPFTIPQLKEVLGQHGNIDGDKFWTDKVKSKCCVMYESVEVAQQTKESLDGQNWPSSNPKKLIISYITDEEYTQHINADALKRVEQPTETVANGASDQSTKPMTNRLGDKIDNNDADIAGPIKKRLGEKVTSGEVNTNLGNLNRASGDGSQSQELDDLFRKTRSKPPLFWLPLTDDQAEIRQKERLERRNKEQERPNKVRRSPPPRRRSPARRHSPRHRSPPRRSPPRYRSSNQRRPSPRRRSPVRGSSPRRHSPKRSLRSRSRSISPMRRSPGLVRRATGPSRRSPEQVRRSPGLTRRSPLLARRSPGPIRRSPGLTRRSPVLTRRSPVLTRRSPGLISRSPGPIRRSPGQMRRSPGLIRRSPGPIRRSPVLVRRSPGAVRRSPNRRSPALGGRSRSRSPQRRSPALRRRTPPRRLSPSNRRFQRTDRL